MTATDSISKEAFLQAIQAIPTERLTILQLLEHWLQLFNVDGGPLEGAKTKAKAQLPELETPPKFDYEAYRKQILQTSTWSDADIAAIEDVRRSFQNWAPAEW